VSGKAEIHFSAIGLPEPRSSITGLRIRHENGSLDATRRVKKTSRAIEYMAALIDYG
jgi:hypothetical protein